VHLDLAGRGAPRHLRTSLRVAGILVAGLLAACPGPGARAPAGPVGPVGPVSTGAHSGEAPGTTPIPADGQAADPEPAIDPPAPVGDETLAAARRVDAPGCVPDPAQTEFETELLLLAGPPAVGEGRGGRGLAGQVHPYVAAELRACAGDVSGFVEAMRGVGALEPVLTEVAERRVAQQTGGATRLGGEPRTPAGALLRGSEALRTALAAVDAPGRIVPAPWMRERLDSARWDRLAPDPPASELGWAWRWLAANPGDAAWLERSRILRELDGAVGDRLVRALCVDHLAEALAATPPRGRGALVAGTVSDCGLEGSGDWLARDDARREQAARGVDTAWQRLAGAGDLEASFEVAWLHRRSDRDAEALPILDALSREARFDRVPLAAIACARLAGGLGDLSTAAGCRSRVDDAVAQRLEPGLDRELEVDAAAVERRWPRPGSFDPGDPITRAKALLVEAATRVGSRTPSEQEAALRSLAGLIAAAPMTYEAVHADRLLRAHGWSSQLAPLFAGLRFSTPTLRVTREVEAAARLDSLGLLGQARNEALLQAEFWGGQRLWTWVWAADLLERRGEARLAHEAARSLLSARWTSVSMQQVPGRVWRTAFPILWEKEVAAAARRQSVPASVLLAFLRRESGFEATVRSGAGALGLMQILPETAREIAARHQISYQGPADLGVPSVDLEIAAAMLSELLDEFGGRIEVAAAAYAAGPTRARAWLRGSESQPLWLWTERIPYPVVRDYAREVALATAVYAAWLGEPEPDGSLTAR
jgi:soluble lytic murein transglycosylase-like protein